MTLKTPPEIVIGGAKTNNLRNVSLRIPHNKLIVVTGVSGSGKSSLVFDLIAKEAQRRYFEMLPSFARQFLGKLNRPNVDVIEGLSPVIAIGQNATGMHARSTVGTMSDIYDLLRLLFARTGKTKKNIKLSRALFSFNSPSGKCQQCNGIGKEEQIDLSRLISYPEKTIREGALAPTLPTGYIMYSQVTIDVLNQVCQAEGFDVEIPWNQLTQQQQDVILYGSQKIKVPFGKHSLESRLKWTGIKAKPREEGYYKGMIPIMSDILRRDRNANILKYVHSVTCQSCKGTRLNEDALSVQVNAKTIAEVAELEITALKSWIHSNSWDGVALQVIEKITRQADVLEDLGLGHLTLNRSSALLRSSEIQRIRVANQILAPLSNVLYVFDEPSIGLHPLENARMLGHFRRIVSQGNTVILVEHDLQTIRVADHVIEVGPGAGVEGGKIIFNGPFTTFTQTPTLAQESPTFRALSWVKPEIPGEDKPESNGIRLMGCHERNLKHIDITFQLGKLNVVSGRSGVGKSSLVRETLVRLVQQNLGQNSDSSPVKVAGHENLGAIRKLIFVNHAPIGKTPRSNPATYLGISDHIRDLFASLPDSKTKGFSKSSFSFNTKGGRCETCQGAGKIQIGMHFLGNVDMICGTCNGDRFNDEILSVKYKDMSIADCYRMSVRDALAFFVGHKKVLRGLKVLHEIGLGYLTLGQSSTTLSGGEAQRIKIANQLQKNDTGDTLFVIMEPSIGLHHHDIDSLLMLFTRIKQSGSTIVCIEQSAAIIQASDWHIELGPNGGKDGGKVTYQGAPQSRSEKPVAPTPAMSEEEVLEWIVLNGVTTHGLKHINVRIPKHQLTVVTGVSGSGKSSLVYDTLLAESNARFSESLSTYNRSFIQQHSQAVVDSFSGLGPAIGINRKRGTPSQRSTVGTLSGVYDAFRLLYSRISQHEGRDYTAQHFSFNHHLGACPECEGQGTIRKCDSEALILAPDKSILDGAFSDNKAVAYYANIHGQFMATLKEVAKQKNWNVDRPWQSLEKRIQDTILYGTGDTEWQVVWAYKTRTKSGTQDLTAKWLGLCTYIEDEYRRKLHNKDIGHLEALMHNVDCPSCHGSRLKKEFLETTFREKNIHELSSLDITTCFSLTQAAQGKTDPVLESLAAVVLPEVRSTLKTMMDLGLGHLNLNRPVGTLSGGERQRVTLSGQLSSHLYGVTYVLDEPTIGLDFQQINVLSGILKQMVSNGNTVVVVEHDPDFIRSADYLIEMGPGAGTMGGNVIFQGKANDIHKFPQSATHQLLQNQQVITIERKSNIGNQFGVKGATANNLKGIDIQLHQGEVTAITGVSGSGKSSLMKDVLYKSWMRGRSVNCLLTKGLDQFEEVVLIDQELRAVNRLSTPVSYLGILVEIQQLFSKSKEAKSIGLKKSDFSYLSTRGKCATCSGHGQTKVSMDFMSDVWITCESCKGSRYHQDILLCNHQGHNIGEILQMTVFEAIEFFQQESIASQLGILSALGVGHLRLGQSFDTLSGGEAQRLKLARSLLNKRTGAVLYLFDEPSTGLHHSDLLRLISVFQTIIDHGDTIVFIEHNRTLIKAANQVITLGPGSGENGGELI